MQHQERLGVGRPGRGHVHAEPADVVELMLDHDAWDLGDGALRSHAGIVPRRGGRFHVRDGESARSSHTRAQRSSSVAGVTRGEAKRDGGRPERLRVFAALDLPGTATDPIAAWQGRALAGRQRLRPIDPGNLHLTLVFLGDRDPVEVERAAAALTALDASGPVSLRLLPDPVGLPRRRPRVIAFDVEGDGAVTLQRDLAERLREAGLIEAPGAPARPFRPHLSVARVRGDPPRGRAAREFVAGLAPLGEEAGHTFDAVRVALYRSELQSRGARYSVLADVELPHRSGG